MQKVYSRGDPCVCLHRSIAYHRQLNVSIFIAHSTQLTVISVYPLDMNNSSKYEHHIRHKIKHKHTHRVSDKLDREWVRDRPAVSIKP